MKSTNVYLTFNGNCAEAVKFYEKSLGGKANVITFAQAPPMPGCGDLPADAKNRIMHAHLEVGPLVLMASDTMPGQPFTAGNNFMINLNCENEQEVDRFFNAIGEGGHTIMPPGETFWAKRFGMLTDKFGVGWMFNLEKPMSADFATDTHNHEPVKV
jgi:PhnB protein